MSDSAPDWIILDSDTASSLTWKGKPMPPSSWSRAWKKHPWMRHLSGLTSPPSTVAAGAARWISSLPDSPVSRTASPENARASPTSVGYGRTSHESWARSNRHLCGSKTYRDLFQPEDSNTSFFDLARLGFDARWGVLGASAVGAAHRRERVFILAYAECGLAWWREQIAIGSGHDGRTHEPQRGAPIDSGWRGFVADRPYLVPATEPVFVCWLMGWPIWWMNSGRINFGSAAMASYRSKLRRHLCCLLGG